MDVQEGYMLKKMMMFLVATNVVANPLPECRPTGTLDTRTNLRMDLSFQARKMI